MIKTRAACVLFAIAIAIATVAVRAPRAFGEDLRDYWNLGSIGAVADLVKGRVVVRGLIPDSPSAGKLKKGDVILRADGQGLGEAPFETLGRSLDRAEKTGVILLGIERAGEESKVKLKLPKLGSYDGAFRANNTKIKKHVKAACTYLVKTQQGGGIWHQHASTKPRLICLGAKARRR